MKEFLYLCSVFIKLIYRMDAKRILFIAQEITPYLPESEIATMQKPAARHTGARS